MSDLLETRNSVVFFKVAVTETQMYHCDWTLENTFVTWYMVEYQWFHYPTQMRTPNFRQFCMYIQIFIWIWWIFRYNVMLVLIDIFSWEKKTDHEPNYTIFSDFLSYITKHHNKGPLKCHKLFHRSLWQYQVIMTNSRN